MNKIEIEKFGKGELLYTIPEGFKKAMRTQKRITSDSEQYIFYDNEEGGYCTYCRKDVPYDSSWRHTREAKCPVCHKKVHTIARKRQRTQPYHQKGFGLLMEVHDKEEVIVARFFALSKNFRKGEDPHNEQGSLCELMRIVSDSKRTTAFWQGSNTNWGICRYPEYYLYGYNRVGGMYGVRSFEWNGCGLFYRPASFIEKAKRLSWIQESAFLKAWEDEPYKKREREGYGLHHVALLDVLAGEALLRKHENNPKVDILDKNATYSYLLECLEKSGFVLLAKSIEEAIRKKNNIFLKATEKDTPYYYGIQSASIRSAIKEQFNPLKKRLHEMLKVDRQTYRKMYERREEITMTALKLSKLFPNEKMEDILAMSTYIDNNNSYGIINSLTHVYRYASLKKMVNYLNKGNSLELWSDYLKDVETLGVVICDKGRKNPSIAIFPKDLAASHGKACEEIFLRENEKKRLERELEYDKITLKCPIFHENYDYVGERYIVVAPNDGHDLDVESKKDRICIRNLNQDYIEKCARGDSALLFVRKKNEANRPYFVMEICGNTIAQVRGFDNDAVSPKHKGLRKFIEEYAKKKNLSVCYDRKKRDQHGRELEVRDGKLKKVKHYT